jgi:hypothetical protein
MASHMRDWIAPVALKELSAAYECFETAYQPGKALEWDHFICSPDAVTVHLTKGRSIQIVDVRVTITRHHGPNTEA